MCFWKRNGFHLLRVFSPQNRTVQRDMINNERWYSPFWKILILFLQSKHQGKFVFTLFTLHAINTDIPTYCASAQICNLQWTIYYCIIRSKSMMAVKRISTLNFLPYFEKFDDISLWEVVQSISRRGRWLCNATCRGGVVALTYWIVCLDLKVFKKFDDT